ncbi:MAG: class I SAM-dependent methyltransferase [Planctomycetes bacterium]|nr:class I SAM-dependent methyltransferase [Planctomycetota bacterium]
MNASGPASDGWAAGDAYEAFMGRWSRVLARAFVAWLDPRPQSAWLDVGCGTGALTAAICEFAEPSSVVACDPATALLDSARHRLADPRVTWVSAGSGSLPAHPIGYDVVASCLALNFFPDPRRAVEEQLSLLRPGGRVAAAVWDYGDGMQLLRHFWDAAVRVEPRAAALHEGCRFPLCNAEGLESAFRAGGAHEVCIEAIEIPTVFEDFGDLWRPFLGGTGPAPAFVADLTRAQRDRLECELRNSLGGIAGGRIALTARAWAVTAGRGSLDR